MYASRRDAYRARLTASLIAMGTRVPAEAPAEAEGSFGRLRVLTVADAFDMPPRTYLLQGIMGEGELSVWWGPPKCGKSFLMLRVAYGLALGLGMWGKTAQRVPVLYIAAEGQKGFGQRIRAIADRLGPAPDFYWIGQAVDLFDASADLAALIKAIKWAGALLVVIDTVARVIPGANENDQKDMGVFVRHCDRIREETGAHVAVVHHGKADSEWGRGSTVLPGAVDLSVRISGGPGLDVARKAEITHAKDDASGGELPFALRGFDLPSVNGEPRSTCLAEELDRAEEPQRPKGRPMNESQTTWLSDLHNLFAQPGLPEIRVPVDGMRGVPTLTRDQVRVGMRGVGKFEMDQTGNLTAKDRDRMRETLNALRDKGKIGLTDKLVWLL